ncbi:MAG: oligopeptide:H+ symporter [Corynebacterium sp.]|nr:oligopeptide:H+ symporter [Corynebacterium sp.]
MTTTEPRSSTSLLNPNHHPLMVRSVISIEAWERFSFYGMQAILGYFLYFNIHEGGLGIPTAQATALVGSYGALVYLCTFAGGWLGDRVLGAERTLLSGAILLVIGHLAMASIGLATPPPKAGLALGLLLIALGSGMLKTAAITILGIAYEHRDAEREIGFQYFYFGIQIAAICGPLLTGWLALHYSFAAGFSAASFLMIIGLGLYALFRRRSYTELDEQLQAKLHHPISPATRPARIGMITGIAALLVLVGMCVATGAITPATLAQILLAATSLTALSLFVLMLRSSKVSSPERKKVRQYIPIFIGSATFWAIMNQTFGVLAVYSQERVNRTIGSFEIPASWSQSLNPTFVILLTVPFAYLWAKLGARNPHPGFKVACGVAIGSCCFFVFIPFAGSGANSTPYLVLAGAIFIATCGEMLCGPVAMAATGGFSPQAFQTQFSALYFLTMAIGTAVAGAISPLYDASDATKELQYFLGCALVGLLIACCCALTTWKLRGHEQVV